MFLNYLLPAFLIGIVLLLPKFRLWLESRAEESKKQSECIELYRSAARDFLNQTDSEKDREVREIVKYVGNDMLNGTKLMRGIITVIRQRKDRNDTSESSGASDSFSNLSDEAKHSFAGAMAAALLASSYQSPIFGGFYRRVLTLMMDDQRKEVAVPSHFINRVQFNRDPSSLISHGSAA